MSFADLVNELLDVLDQALVALVVLSLLVFLWRLFVYTFQSTNAQAREEARTYLLYAFIGLVVITSLWGFVQLLVGAITFPAP